MRFGSEGKSLSVLDEALNEHRGSSKRLRSLSEAKKKKDKCC